MAWSHKTYLGFIAGYTAALLILLVQRLAQGHGVLDDYRLLDYDQISLPLYAFLFGVGSLTGDALKSFAKRRLKKKPGSPWVPFDQLDFVFGALLFLLPFYALAWEQVFVVLLVTPLLHLLTNIVGFAIGLKNEWW